MRIIELKWNCNSCDVTDILGRHKVCPQCGSPRESGEMKMSGLESDSSGYNPAPSVTDKELLDLAKAGYDWFCVACSAGNRGDKGQCTSCGWTQQEVAPKQPKPKPKKRPELEFEENFTAPKVVYLSPFLLALGIGIPSVLFILLAYFFFSTQPVEGTIESGLWEHQVQVQEWTPIKVRQWQHQTTERREIPPVRGRGEQAGFVPAYGSCRDEHWDDEKYQCGTKPEDYDCSTTESYQDTCTKSVSYVCGETCRDNGNGFATCTDKMCSKSVDYPCAKERKKPKTCTRDVPKYCSRAIYRPKCDYTTQEWRKSRLLTERGVGSNTKWPEPTLSNTQRFKRSGTYSIKVSYPKGIYTFHPDNEIKYREWMNRKTVTLQINGFGGVRGVMP